MPAAHIQPFKRIGLLLAAFGKAHAALAAAPNSEPEKQALEDAKTALLGYTPRGQKAHRHRMTVGCMSRTLHDRSRYMPAVEDRKHGLFLPVRA